LILQAFLFGQSAHIHLMESSQPGQSDLTPPINYLTKRNNRGRFVGVADAICPSDLITDSLPFWRSKITNGSDLVSGVGDKRTARHRRYRCVDLLTHDAGGAANITFAGQQMIKHAAALIVEGEEWQARIVRGEQIDHAALVAMTNALTRIP
jgi:hypothetical protein